MSRRAARPRTIWRVRFQSAGLWHRTVHVLATDPGAAAIKARLVAEKDSGETVLLSDVTHIERVGEVDA